MEHTLFLTFTLAQFDPCLITTVGTVGTPALMMSHKYLLWAIHLALT
jgi:hypothetical protein